MNVIYQLLDWCFILRNEYAVYELDRIIYQFRIYRYKELRIFGVLKRKKTTKQVYIYHITTYSRLAGDKLHEYNTCIAMFTIHCCIQYTAVYVYNTLLYTIHYCIQYIT